MLRKTGVRLFIFYGATCTVLAALGARRLGAVPQSARRVFLAAIGAGLALAVLRVAFPVVFGDAKEVELLAGPVAVLAAWPLTDLLRRKMRWKLVGLALAASLVAWALWRAVSLYAERLVVAVP